MTPQLKYGIIALIALLNICGVLYLLYINQPRPPQQTAVKPPTPTPQPAPPPMQQPVSQPPVQPPAPTPYQLQQQRERAERNECDQKETNYYKILVTDAVAQWQEILNSIQTYARDQQRRSRLQAQLVNLLDTTPVSIQEWQQAKARCLRVTGWAPTKFVGMTDEYTMFRKDCQRRDGNYKDWFGVLKNMNTRERDVYLTSRGEHRYEQFVREWQELEQQCAQKVPGWVTPASTNMAYEQQARTPY